MNKNLTVVRVAQGLDYKNNNKNYWIYISEWWVKVRGKQNPLSASGISPLGLIYGKNFNSDGNWGQTYRHYD